MNICSVCVFFCALTARSVIFHDVCTGVFHRKKKIEEYFGTMTAWWEGAVSALYYLEKRWS